MAVRVGINGMGRIGRGILRAWLDAGRNDIEIVAANDLADPALIAHLLAYDSTHGPLGQEVSVAGDATLRVGERTLSLSAEPMLGALDWGNRGVDLVFECTGRFKNAADMQGHLDAGAQRVLLSAPGGKDLDRTVVFGINHEQLTPTDRFVSNASCTTNCLAPITQVLHAHFGITSGLMTTVHSYTNDQMLLDGPHKDPRRARAAALAMIPTSTGAADALGLVLPEMKGRMTGYSMRVPTPNVSVVDLTVHLEKEASAEQIAKAMQVAADGHLRGVLAVNEAPLVSGDFNHNPASSVFDATQTLVRGELAKVLSWYDNEWGFSNRMLDVGAYWGGLA